jgi:hypothetical protein
MGDRSNIAIHYGSRKVGKEEIPQRVYIYTHWMGTDIAIRLRDACASKEGRNRFGDEFYFARIIFDRVVGDDQGGELGFGLGPTIGDNEHNVLVTDSTHVWVETEGGTEVGQKVSCVEFGTYTNEQAVAFMEAGEERDLD